MGHDLLSRGKKNAPWRIVMEHRFKDEIQANFEGVKLK